MTHRIRIGSDHFDKAWRNFLDSVEDDRHYLNAVNTSLAFWNAKLVEEDYTYIDLIFNSKKDYAWFLLRWS